MAYNLTLSSGEALVTIADGTVDVNFTSLSLIGKNFAGYGALMNENFVYLLENFSNSAAPTNPVTGQLWYDSYNRVMKVYTANSTWKTISSATASPTPPVNPAIGDQWWATHPIEQLNVWTGPETGWKLVGPLWTVSEGLTGSIPDTVMDISGIPHVIIKFYINELVSGIWSKDPTYTCAASDVITGFDPIIKPGITFVNLSPISSDEYTLHATVDNSLKFDGRSITDVLQLDSSTDQVVVGTVTFEDIYADIFHGTASSAQYADLAERYAADAVYPAGTVVMIGGTHEITLATGDLNDEVFGVISTNPAYLMNSEAGTNETHPPVVLSGRAPVLVTGVVTKGDRLVCAGNGTARAATKAELTPWNVIGRALANKTDTGLGTVDAFVKISS